MTRSFRKSSVHTRGFTLVEALVALVVLSIGLLGIASLQLSSLRWNHGASMRSQATLLAYDILDRMRVNQISAKKGDYDVALAGTKGAGTVAGDDIIRWKASLIATLPDGDGAVEREVTATATTYHITVQWNDSRGVKEANSADNNTTIKFELRTQI